MAKPTRIISHSKQITPPLAQQRLIAEQTEAFLAGGGKIQQVPNGVSGQSKLGGPTFSATGKS